MTTYKDAGVDIKSTDALVENISSLSKMTNRSGNVDGIGGFGGIFDLKKCIFLKVIFHEKTYLNRNRTKVLLLLLLLLFLLLMCLPKHPLRKNTPNPE